MPDEFTIAQGLSLMDDQIFAIEEINTNGQNSQYIPSPQTQEAVNAAMDRYVKTLEGILLWNGLDADENPREIPQPDIAGYSGDKSTYTDAITLGKAYIAANS